MSHIFISHSTKDKATALLVLDRLRQKGYQSLFLDSDPESGITAGVDWERDLYRSLKLSGAVVVLCSPDSMASRWCFAEITQAKALGKALFPVVIRPCEVIGSLADRQAIDMAKLGEEEGFTRLFDGLRAAGLDPFDSFNWDATRPPFPGLLYFDREDAGIYFGRDPEVRQVIETLTRMRRQGEPRLAVIVGSSGSGKSSLVRAGVLPRLGKDLSQWVVVPPFRLSDATSPLGALRVAFSKAFDEAKVEISRRPSWLAPDADAATLPALGIVADQFRQATGRHEASVLITVDQAEELIQAADPEKTIAFMTALLDKQASGRVFALLTLRSDYLGSFQNHPAFRDIPFANVTLGLLPIARFGEVIEKPAARAGIELEEGLVNEMTRDACRDDALPVLAFTLREMYERRRDQSRLTLKVYREDLGGIKGAVAKVVERIKKEAAWTPEVGLALRRAFLKLARINDEGQFSRKPARKPARPDLAAPVLEEFVRSRLLTSNGDMVEVTHESLFRVWPELAGWLDEGRELMLWKKGIQDELRVWTAHDRSADWLLGGARAAEARRWLASNPGDFPEEAEFLSASIAAEDERVAREQAQKERLGKLARGLAVAAAVASLLAVGSLGVGLYAYSQRGQAITQRDAAKAATKKARSSEDAATKSAAEALIAAKEAQRQSRVAAVERLAAQARAEAAMYPQRALLLAVEALKASSAPDLPYTPAAEQALRDALALSGGRELIGKVRLGAETNEANQNDRDGATISPDGRWLVVSLTGKLTRIWDLNAPEETPRLFSDLNVSAHLLKFSPDGRWLVDKGLGSSGIRLWASPRWNEVPRVLELGGLPGDLGPIFSQDGRRLVVDITRPSKERVLRAWDLSRPGSPPVDRACPLEGELYLALDQTGRRLAVARPGSVIAYDLDAPASDPPARHDHADGHGRLDFSSGGHRLISYGRRSIRLWEWPEGKGPGDSPVDLPVVSSGPDGPSSWKEALGFSNRFCLSPDRGKLLAVAPDGRLTVWNLTADDLVAAPLSLQGPTGIFADAAFSRDDRRLAVATETGQAYFWDLNSGETGSVPTPLTGQAGRLRNVAFSPDGRRLAAYHGGAVSSMISSAERAVYVWRTVKPTEPPLVLRGAEDGNDPVAFAANSRRIVGISDSFGRLTARVWDIENPEASAILRSAHEVATTPRAMTPDGRWLLTVGQKPAARLWSVDDPAARPIELLEGKRLDNDFETAVTAWAFVRGGGRVVLVDASGTVRRWDIRNLPGEPPGPEVLPMKPRGMAALSSDGRRFASMDGNGTLRVWDLDRPDAASRDYSFPKEAPDAGKFAPLRLLFSPDGSRLFGSLPKVAALYVWDLDPQGEIPRRLPKQAHSDLGSDVFHPTDGRSLFTFGERGLCIWDLNDLGKPPRVLGHVEEAGPSGVTYEGIDQELGIDPNGRRIVAWNGDSSTPQVWDLTRPEAPPRTLRGHSGKVTDARLSNDANTLATIAFDGTVRVWRLDETEPGSIALEIGAGTSVTTLAISPDGRWLFAGSADGRLFRWPLDRKETIRIAKVTAGRNLELDEWARFFPGQTYRPTFADLPMPFLDPRQSDIAINLSLSQWSTLFPDQSYRKSFPTLPVPADVPSPEIKSPLPQVGK